MLQGIVNIAKSATAFLQNGVAPPNTAPAYKEALEDENHFASKKFFIIFTATLILAVMYFSSVAILFLIPEVPEKVVAYTTMFTKSIEILSIIIATYLGTQAAVDLRYNSNSNVGIQGNVDIIKEERILTHNTKEDDYNISEIDV
jgi:hypothetical protein